MTRMAVPTRDSQLLFERPDRFADGQPSRRGLARDGTMINFSCSSRIFVPQHVCEPLISWNAIQESDARKANRNDSIAGPEDDSLVCFGIEPHLPNTGQPIRQMIHRLVLN